MLTETMGSFVLLRKLCCFHQVNGIDAFCLISYLQFSLCYTYFILCTCECISHSIQELFIYVKISLSESMNSVLQKQTCTFTNIYNLEVSQYIQHHLGHQCSKVSNASIMNCSLEKLTNSLISYIDRIS